MSVKKLSSVCPGVKYVFHLLLLLAFLGVLNFGLQALLIPSFSFGFNKEKIKMFTRWHEKMPGCKSGLIIDIGVNNFLTKGHSTLTMLY